MPKPPASKSSSAISALSVKGFKSIADEQSIEVRPLTILAGANSSGKSSMMQPLLLLKQTLEAQYDPGPLLLNGPNVKFTSVGQIVPVTESGGAGKTHLLSVAVRLSDGIELVVEFSMHTKSIGIKLESNTIFFHEQVVS
jgi:predicted ATPase